MIRALPHAFSGTLGMTYAYWISTTEAFQTGVQFVAPVAVMLLAHLFLLRADPWPLRHAINRTALTCMSLIAGLALGHVLLPMPAQANDVDSVFAVVGTVIACVLVIAVVGLAVALAILFVYRMCRRIFAAVLGPNDDHTSREGAGMILVLALLGGLSLEGLGWAYTFDGQGEASASVSIDAQEDDVWRAMQTAISPAVPLPHILNTFPRPVDVLVDEGTTLGANRAVLFDGREGEGDLRLRVTEVSDRHAQFSVLENTSPMANWIAILTLTYRIAQTETETHLEVSLSYDRLLAPAWVFDPLMKATTYLAMSVLARDVKARSEALGSFADKS